MNKEDKVSGENERGEGKIILPGRVTSRRYALDGDWQASASKSRRTVPMMVKNIPQG